MLFRRPGTAPFAGDKVGMLIEFAFLLSISIAIAFHFAGRDELVKVKLASPVRHSVRLRRKTSIG